MRLLRRAAVVLGAVAVLAVGALFALGRAYNVGPLAPGAPRSWLYVAVVRSDEDDSAKEIEVIDTESGARRVFDARMRATDVALSLDRRTLLVGAANGRVLALDAISGTEFREYVVSVPGTVHRIVPFSAERILVVAGHERASGVALLDLVSGAELDRTELSLIRPGRSTLTADRRGLLVPAVDRTSSRNADVLLRLGIDPLRIDRALDVVELSRAIAQASPGALALGDGGMIVASALAGQVSLFPIDPRGGRRDLVDLLPKPGGRPLPFRGVDLQTDLALGPDGSTLHVCFGTATVGVRYRVPLAAFSAERVADECGRFARGPDGTLYLGVRGRSELRVADPTSGAVLRTLPLTGLAWRLAN